MKRFVFWFIVGTTALALVRSNRRDDRHDHRAPVRTVVIREGATPETRQVVTVERDGRVVVLDQGRDATHNRHERDEIREAVEGAREAIRDATDGVRDAVAEAREAAHDAAEEVRGHAREFVDGVPVPVVPGSRVTEARAEPPRPPAPPKPPKRPKAVHTRVRVGDLKGHVQVHMPPKPPEPAIEPLVVKGLRSATEERARNDARVRLVNIVTEKLEPEVPRTWRVPADLIDGLVQEVRITPVERDYGTVYEAEMRADFSPHRRAQIVSAYRHEQTLKRLGMLGALLAFILVCLATVSGYIRADEATKGYYTSRLRLAAAAGVGAAGVLAYRLLS